MTDGSDKKECDYNGHSVRIQAEERPATVFRADLWIDGERIPYVVGGDYEPRPKPTRSSSIEDAIAYAEEAARRIIDKMTRPKVTDQLYLALQLAKKHKLTNLCAAVRCNHPVPDEIVNQPLKAEAGALRDLEVWITDHDGYIEGVVGDHEDGRKSVTYLLD